MSNKGNSLFYKGTDLPLVKFCNFVTGGLYYCLPDYVSTTCRKALYRAALSNKSLFKKAIVKFISLMNKLNDWDTDWRYSDCNWSKLGMENLTHVFDYKDNCPKWKTTENAKETKKHNDFKSRMADMMNGL